MQPAADPYDVIIVGAGLAGLAAAQALQPTPHRRVLVVEKEDHVGGRVLTRVHDGMACDLGAVFACNTALLPTPVPLSAPISEDGPVGLLHEGRLVLERDVPACLRAVDTTGQERAALEAWARRGFRGLDALPPRLRSLLSAFFHVIHPGPMERYLPERQRDALVRHPAHHRPEGNGEVVQALAAALQDRDLLLGAQVDSIRPRGSTVEVSLRTGSGTARLHARTVICTAPAPGVLPLLGVIRPPARRFLEAVEFAEGTVVVLRVPPRSTSPDSDEAPPGTDSIPALPAFSYVVTPDLPSSMVLQQVIPGTTDHLCHVYFTGEASRSLATLTPADAAARATDVLRALAQAAHLPPPPAPRMVDFARWPHLGPVISPEAYGAFTPAALEPCERVFLAGDYTCPDPGMPYGMEAAIRSGQQAAGRVDAFLREDDACQVFAHRPLVEAWLYRLDPHRPRFLGRLLQGTVALQGWLLQAHPDDTLLRDWLLHQSRDGLWEYDPGFGVTCEDSCIVLEGLLAARVSPERLAWSAQRLVDAFWDEPPAPALPAFHTIREGRASYWHGPSIDATAMAGWLLLHCGSPQHEAVIRACARHLEARQDADGAWRGRWFPSPCLTTFHAVRLLQSVLPSSPALERARAFLLGGARSEAPALDTAATIRALDILDETSAALERRSWLQDMTSGSVPPQPLLYYWLEVDGARAGDDSPRTFVHALDRGQVTSAWIRLALDPPASPVPSGVREEEAHSPDCMNSLTTSANEATS